MTKGCWCLQNWYGVGERRKNLPAKPQEKKFPMLEDPPMKRQSVHDITLLATHLLMRHNGSANLGTSERTRSLMHCGCAGGSALSLPFPTLPKLSSFPNVRLSACSNGRDRGACRSRTACYDIETNPPATSRRPRTIAPLAYNSGPQFRRKL